MTSTQIFRPTIAEINRAALAHNLQVLCAELPVPTQVLAVVKADAYGHGAVVIARWLAEMGVRAFAVATIEEGLELRQAGITQPIVVLAGLWGTNIAAAQACVAHDLMPVVHTPEVLPLLDAAARDARRTLSVHLKIDTGMSRLGVRPEVLPSVLQAWVTTSHLRLDGLMTHFADAATPATVTEQLQCWNKCVKEVRAVLGIIPRIHIANSAAIMRHILPKLEVGEQLMVRPGIGLYNAVMQIRSQVMLIKSLPAGSHVSYGWTFTMPRAGRIAVAPIGYADGYPWNASGKAFVLIRGQRLPVVGRVTMDMIMVDVTDQPQIAVGDEVVMLGQQGDQVITADDLAQWSGTIAYEIFCRVSQRIPRRYVDLS